MTGLAEALLGLDGFKVLGVAESEDELVIAVETTASVTGCWSCGVVAECQDRVRVDVRDLVCFGRPAISPTIRTAAVLLDKANAGCLADDVPEVRSLGNTLKRWRSEILAHHETGASNGPTEGLNLCVKEVKRAGHGCASFEHYADTRIMPMSGADVRWGKGFGLGMSA